MFCLPNLRRMSEQAEKARKANRRRRSFMCDGCNEQFNIDDCRRQNQPYFIEEWHDSLSEGAKGIMYLCPKCAEENLDHYGEPFSADDYFRCADCGKLFITRYSWELLCVEAKDSLVCIPCAAKRYLAPDSDKWLTTADKVRAITESAEALEGYGPEHLSAIGSEMAFPFGVVSFRDTAEYGENGCDFYNKLQFGAPDGRDAVADARACLLAALRFYGKLALVVSACSQFQQYADVIVDPASRRAEPLPSFGEEEALAHGARGIPAGCFPDFITRLA